MVRQGKIFCILGRTRLDDIPLALMTPGDMHFQKLQVLRVTHPCYDTQEQEHNPPVLKPTVCCPEEAVPARHNAFLSRHSRAMALGPWESGSAALQGLGALRGASKASLQRSTPRQCRHAGQGRSPA